jgi:hypothetical protein
MHDRVEVKVGLALQNGMVLERSLQALGDVLDCDLVVEGDVRADVDINQRYSLIFKRIAQREK